MKKIFLVVSFLASAVAFACPSDQICTGDRIIDSSGHVGKAIEVFANGAAKVSLDSFSGYHIREVRSLGKGVSCYGSLCVGNRIIDAQEHVGKLIEVFNNGRAKVSLDAYSGYHIREISDLGKGVYSVSELEPGSRVIDQNGYVGKIIEVFSNGKAKVSLDAFSGYYIRNTNLLGKGFSCIEHVCVGTRVIDSNSHTGKLIELFDNGKAKVSLDAFSGYCIRSFESLGIRVNCQPRMNFELIHFDN